MHAQTLGKGGLSRRGGTRNKNDLEFGVVGDVVGNLRNLLFLQGFGHVDQIVGVACLDGLVEFAHGGAAQNVLPVVLLLKHAEDFALLLHGAELEWVLWIGHTQQQSVAVAHHVKERELSGAEEERPVKVVERTIQRIVVRVEVADAFEELHLLGETL